MVSSEGELVPFKKPIDPAKANGAVEKWLAQVSHMCVPYIFVCLFSSQHQYMQRCWATGVSKAHSDFGCPDGPASCLGTNEIQQDV